MPIDAELSFTEGVEPFPNAHVFYVEYVDALNEPFAVTVGLTTTDPVDPRALLGARVALSLVGEPWLNEISGVVVAFKQRSAPGLAHGAAAYELEIKPALALLARRTARRIHQNTDVLGALERMPWSQPRARRDITRPFGLAGSPRQRTRTGLRAASSMRSALLTTRSRARQTSP